MKLVNDIKDPELVGLLEVDEDFVDVAKIVNSLNEDLVDSGFDQYQYKAVRRGNKVYVERVGA